MEEKQTIHITTEKELRTYMHPLRQNILFELSLRPQGMTAKQLADALGIAPSSAGHHLGKLEQMGLAELARTEVIHGFCAKFYKAADVTVNIDVHRAAPLMHKALGTEKTGAVRFSFSYFNTEEEIDMAAMAVRKLASEIED